VNKEEIIGMLVALEVYLSKDHQREWEQWVERTKTIAAAAETVPTVKGETYISPGPANHFPGLRLNWDQARVKITPRAIADALRNGDPSIQVPGGNTLDINVAMMEPGEAEIVARRLREELERAAT
jgi:L-seryl-tRNA(Ser) seleniumtransferase